MNKFVSKNVCDVIGFSYLMSQLTITSPYGYNYMEKKFNNIEINKAKLETEYSLIYQFIDILPNSQKLELNLSKFKDITHTLKYCVKGKVLDIVELYEVKIQAILMNELSDLLKNLNINSLKLESCFKIIEILSPDSNITNDFYIYPCYSKKLKSIREEKRRIEHEFYKTTDEVLREELKSKRSKYVILEAEEELDVRVKLSTKLKQLLDIMIENSIVIGHLDFLIAKARLAKIYSGTKPILTKSNLRFVEMSNPYTKEEVENSGNHYKKNSIDMNEGTTIITGANMGGKSSIIKTIALNVLLSHMGFFVFAKKAEIPIFYGIEYISGDSLDSMHGLSSFGFEIVKLNEAIAKIKSNKYLVCVDEFARSTNPSEGQKFVKAFVEFSNKFNSITILSTHYDGVYVKNINHYQIVGLKENEFVKSINDINKLMDYSLKKVSYLNEVPKEAYKVSLLLNIDNDFKQYLDKCYMESDNIE